MQDVYKGLFKKIFYDVVRKLLFKKFHVRKRVRAVKQDQLVSEQHCFGVKVAGFCFSFFLSFFFSKVPFNL